MNVRGLAGLLPWGIVLAIGAAAILLLVDRQPMLGRGVLGFVLIGHGLVHVLYLVPPPSPPARRSAPRWPFDLSRSWLARRAGSDRSRRIAIALIGIVAGTSVLAALALIGIVLPTSLWPALVVTAAAASLVLLAVAFDPQLLLGMGIDVALLLLVVAGWSPTS